MTYYTPQAVPLHGPEYAADPHAVYDRLRQYGPVAPVEISPGVTAYLVVGYRAALDLLRDTETWSKDSRAWQQTVPPDCPVLPMLGWRPNVLFNDGDVHARYRSVITDSFSLVEPHELRARTVRAADELIREFAGTGEADLVAQYARPLPLLLFNALFGMPEHDSPRLVAALAGMLEARSPEEATAAGAEFERYVLELVALKQREPGDDLASWFMEHPAGLEPEEVVHQIVLTMGAGHEPTSNLISNALSRMLSNPDYYGTLTSGARTALDAVGDVLRHEPPLANYSAHFPRHNVRFHGTWIHANQLVLVSYAAANSAPDGLPPDVDRADGGAHLAWSAGPHSCPVKQPALLIATTAIERLTGHLCDLELTVPRERLSWRPGPFHRALSQLPARFSPVSPDQAGVTPWTTASP
ncbi:cytochrome P450 [Streptomyces alkaliterrae]|uniref:Cytochrome P450 n=1 Tax=Streptomyces alkaliterrae TaxID=2213162 RepID=A0A5P0YWX9_9ACTN|nr:cytochrome P450 [Streptomyces alkaliterrae]MBB1252510.1 cytochrome P450 [Streptomyces alkaliterrae]MBB1261087.1 cytochrome P450 [Streptomyces alkaliterrae]MQS02999.1 cytochrome P450 [Streptomyces alkaliterrae]